MSPDPDEPSGSHPRASRLVLVGGGHSHVQVLESFVHEPPPAEVTVIVDTPVAVYSGMVPGFVAGQYDRRDLEIDVAGLARRAGAELVVDPVARIEVAAGAFALRSGARIPYDLASINIGSTVAGLEVPGVRDHALPSRPIGRFVERVDGAVSELAGSGGEIRVVVVGGGAGGVEVAFCVESRIRKEGGRPSVRLVDDRPRLLEGSPRGLARRVEERARERGVEICHGGRVVSAAAAAVEVESLASGARDRWPCDLLLWVAGAASHGIFEASGLPTDDRGFVLVEDDLRVRGVPRLFAAGDCATLAGAPETPKAGVYAVRQGPVLERNLRALLVEAPLERYRPQSDFLTLLNLGDGTAVGAKWGRSFSGRWVMWLKDKIDRRFVERFRPP